MIVYRTSDLATITPCVLAINHSAKIRLRCSWTPYAVGNGMTGERSSVVLERYEERIYHREDGTEAFRDLDWYADESSRLPATEQRIDGVRGAMGSPYAYCAVHSVAALREWADREGMSWVARERASR